MATAVKKKPALAWLAKLSVLVVLAFLGWGLYLAFQPQVLPLQGQMDAQEVNVSSKVPGRVAALHVQLGQTVKPGELLFELASPEVQAKIAQVTAAGQAAQALASKAEAGARPEEIEAARYNWQRAQTAYAYVMALAQLLEACGEPERLAALASSADIVFPAQEN